MVGGRVKTWHPAMHGGIVARRNPAHLNEFTRHHLTPIDDVVVNLSPVQETVAQSGVTLADAVEAIDIERNRFESSQATRLNRAVGLYFGLLA